MIFKKSSQNTKFLSQGVCIITCVACLSTAFLTGSKAESSDAISAQGARWGITLDDFTKNLGDNVRSIRFTPKDKPDYKNKLMSYITAIDNAYLSHILIIRTMTVPQTDYLFIKGKLYTILEDWHVVNAKKQDSILNDLKKRYGEASIAKDGNFSIISFNTPATKVLFYKLVYADGTAKCKVYYYTNKLFRMLIMDQ